MDNAQKAIMIGVGLFITIIVIAAVMLITGMGQDMLVSGQQEVSNISASLQSQLTSDFDGTTVTGAQVITAVKRYYKDEAMIVMVDSNSFGKIKGTLTGDSATGYTVPSVDKQDAAQKIGILTDKSASNTANYVANTGKYKANLIKIVNTDDVVGIKFDKIGSSASTTPSTTP